MLFCHLGSSSEDSHSTAETDNVSDLVVSSSSASLRKKKRVHGIANYVVSHRGEMSHPTNNSSDEEKQKGKIYDDTGVDDFKGNEEAPRKNIGSKKIAAQKIEDGAGSNDSYREEEVLKKTNTFEEKRSHRVDEYELSGVSDSEDQDDEQYQRSASNHDNSNVHRNEDNTRKTKLTKKSKVQ